MKYRKKAGEKRHNSAWLFNSVANKHADAMDNFPRANVLPRNENDKALSEALSKIIPVLLDRNNFEQTYSDAWWYKLKTGNALYCVFWNAQSENCEGEIEIKKCDLLNLFWDDKADSLNSSDYLFYVTEQSAEAIKNMYGIRAESGAQSGMLYKYEKESDEDFEPRYEVVDVYYKKWQGKRKELHYVKYCGNSIIYASENDKSLVGGWYSHGEYPFVLDTLFKAEGEITGFGYVDIMKDCEEDIDSLNDAIIRNAELCSRQRYFYRQDGSVNKEEFADLSRDFVHVEGNLDEENLRQIRVNPLNSEVFTALSMKIDELKETSGNRDFSQGGVSSGVTAASAIAALQEAGSKLSRDMIKSSFRAFTKICCLITELIKQFYKEPRIFRITENGEISFLSVGGKEDTYFDIEVSAEKSTPFLRAAGNELAKQLYSMGFFSRDKAEEALAALSLMDFENKQSAEKIIRENLKKEEAL